jgi:glutaredoxin
MAYCKDVSSLLVFYSPSCHKCIQAKKNIIPQIEQEFIGQIAVEYHDISDIRNYSRMLALRDKYNSKLKLTVPVFFINGRMLNGEGDLKANLRNAVLSSLEGAVPTEQESLNADLLQRFHAFKPIAIAGAGLADGVNPCAFTVIVFFVSYLALQGYRKRELIFIGVSFIFSVFLTYVLIGLGIFSFFYQLANFWVVSRLFNIIIGVFSIVLGILAIYDSWKFKKTGNTDGLLLQLPKSVKNQIHSVIGLHYRNKAKVVYLPRLILSALITGFLVSILEAVCTGQLYLPTIAFIFKTTAFKLKAFIYLIMYNIMFVFPLLVIFIFSLLGATSGQFARLMNKHILSVKIFMALFFLTLGVFLVWRG